MIPKRGEVGGSGVMDMPATKRHRATPDSTHIHRPSSSPSLSSPSDPCHCSHTPRFSPTDAPMQGPHLHAASQHTPADVTYKLDAPSSRPARHALHSATNHETESTWGFISPFPAAFSSAAAAHIGNHTAIHHELRSHSPNLQDAAPDPGASTGKTRIYIPSRGRFYSSVAEAVEHAAPGEEITLAPGVYVETRPIVLQVDGVTLRAAEEGDEDPEGDEGMEVEEVGAKNRGQSSPEAKEGGARPRKGGVRLVCKGVEPHAIVCRGWGVRVVGIQVMQVDGERAAGGGAVSSTGEGSGDAQARAPAGEGEGEGEGEGAGVEGNETMGPEGGRESSMGGEEVDRCCVSVAEGDCTLQGCELTSVGGYGAMVWGVAAPSMRECVFTGCRHAAVICGGYSRTAFRQNRVHGNGGFGVVVVDCAGGKFEGNVIAGNGKCGVVCAGKSEAVFDGNDVSEGAQGGFWLRDETKCVIAKCTVRGNARVGIQVSDASDPLVEGNEIRGGRNGGVVVHDRAKGRFVSNDVVDNAQAGIGVMDDASPLFVGNRLQGNRAGGAVMAGNATAVLNNNSISDNGFAGIGLKECAKPVLIDNRIVNNRGYGVLVHGQSHCEVSGCLLEGNYGSGLCASGSSRVGIRSCTVRGGEGVHRESTGLQVQDSAHVEVKDCVVTGHSGSNVFGRDESSLVLRAGFVSHAHGAGLVLQGRCRARMEGVQVGENRVCNVIALDKSSLDMVKGAVSDSRGVGVMVSAGARAALEGVAVSGNGGAGIYGTGGGSVVVKGCRVSGSGGGGVVMDGVGEGLVEGSIVWGNGCGGGVTASGGARVSVLRSVVMGGGRDGVQAGAGERAVADLRGDTAMEDSEDGGGGGAEAREGRGEDEGRGREAFGEEGAVFEECLLEEGIGQGKGCAGFEEAEMKGGRGNRWVARSERERVVEGGLEELDKNGRLGMEVGGEEAESSRRRGVVVEMVGGGVMIGRTVADPVVGGAWNARWLANSR